MIIGLTGCTANDKIAGAGKSEVCKELQRLLGATVYAFADPIYTMIEAGFGINRHQSKSEPIPWLDYNGEETTLRYLLETLGTEWGRNIVHDNLWVILADRFVNACKAEHILIDGVRFENEAQWIKDKGGVIISVWRPDYLDTSPAANHPSNEALHNSWSDFTLINDGDIDDLKEKLRRFVDKYL